MVRILAAALLVCSAALAFDCDTLHEPARTRCLDRAADMNLGIMPAHNEDVQSASDDSEVDDVMGDLGEGAKTKVKATAKAQAKEDMRLAEEETEGMYDDDVEVAKAFSDFDDDMDDLKTHIGLLHSNMKVADTENQVREEYEREEEEDETSRERELGEADSLSKSGAHGLSSASKNVLDASASDLAGDLDVHFHVDTAPDTEHKVEDLMKQLHSISGHQSAKEQLVSVLDDATEFVQFTADDGLTNDLTLQDLANSDKSLVDRARVEAKQTNDMEDDDDLESEAHDLGDAESMEESATKLDVLDQTLVDHPSLDKSTGEQEAEEVVMQDEDSKDSRRHEIGEMAHQSAVAKAAQFASAEDKREEAAIKRAQDREKKMEEDAKDKMYAEMKKMKVGVQKMKKAAEKKDTQQPTGGH